MNFHRSTHLLVWLSLVLALSPVTHGAALNTAFTYQGRLVSTNQAAPGSYDMRFRLYDAEVGGAPVTGDRFASNIVVGADGLFAALVDFGSVFQGTSYWLETAVKTNGSAVFSLLAPRLPLTAMPYALYALKAGTATTASNVTGMIANSQLPSNVARLDANQTFAGQNSFSSNVGIGTPSPLARLEIQGGADNGGNNDPKALALAWHDGGYRHWIRTRHNADLSTGLGNAIDFYLNASTTAAGSAAPDNGSLLAMTLDSGKVGIGTTNPRERLDVLGNILWGNTNALSLDQGGSIELGDSASVSNTPYLDFHYGIGFGQDYNVRLINNASGWLTLDGNLSVSGKFAAGVHARANHAGTFVWADSNDNDFTSENNNGFAVRATGGVRFVSGLDGSGHPASGVFLAPGGTGWEVLSDRNVKENFQPVDGREILQRVATLPIQSWNMKTQSPEIRHIGPMAQDFAAAFSVGSDDRHINTVDADGVALAAIQGLHTLLEEKDQKLEAQAAELKDIKERLAALEKLANALARDSRD